MKPRLHLTLVPTPIAMAAGGAFLSGLLLVVGVGAAQGTSPEPAKAVSPASPEERAAELLARMTLDDKIALIHGDGFQLGRGYAGHVPANARLGIPELFLADGPNGVGNGSQGVTAFPAAANSAATWDMALLRRYGEAVGQEQAGKGNNVALAPTINILRVPQWGRGFETLSEDPFLTARLATEHIKGIQAQGVIATAKHFAANNQETDRMRVDVQVSERALNEIYFPAFRAAVEEAGVGAVMCSYNKLNGPWACEQPSALQATLKDAWGFKGFVMSDWFATHSSAAAANAGLDMEMPAGRTPLAPEYFGEALKRAVEAGEVSQAKIDEKVRRILVSMFRAGLFDRPASGSRSAVVTSPAHEALARELAEKGMVLLKNDRAVLPLLLQRVRSIALIGDAAAEHAKLTGGGSAAVVTARARTPLAGIKARVGKDVTITHARGTLGTAPLPALSGTMLVPPSGQGSGLEATYFASPDLSGPAVLTRVEPRPGGTWWLPPAPGLKMPWSARWKGTLKPSQTGPCRFSLNGSGTARLLIDGAPVVANRSEFGGLTHGLVDLVADKPVALEIEYMATGLFGATLQVGYAEADPAMFAVAVKAAKEADVAVVFVDDTTTEGADRTTLALPGDQDRLVAAVAAANPRTVVVLNTGGPVLMPWLDQVATVIEAWYPGQEYGDALAAVLVGDVNPSGKLPMTFPASDHQGPAATPAAFPGDGAVVRYDEGLLVGYRWYDAKGERPLFPFGHGLSYTNFTYGRLKVSPAHVQGQKPVTVSVAVGNMGTRQGAEVVQLYLAFPAESGEPPRQLKGFERVELKPGQKRTVRLTLDARSRSVWDESKHAWVAPAGTFGLMVGSSSRDVRAQASFEVANE